MKRVLIAHDLNNVLAPILMAVEVLKQIVADQEGLALLSTLETSAQRGADLVRQVLSFARGIEGQRVTVNPLHIVRELLQVMRDTFPKTIDVHFSSGPNLWTVTGDPTQMHQVFLNLCLNARDAMPAGGDLTLRIENVTFDDTYSAMNPDAHPGDYVLVRFEDTGEGITKETRERVFEPFYTTKEIGKGTGLGLSTSLAIVRSHGGFITFQSEPGKGTVFSVHLPANTAETASTDPPPERERLPVGHNELILVVDDEPAIRSIAQNTLERFGYQTLLACNGAEGASLYAQHRLEIAAVLVDMTMPVMDGPALIQQLLLEIAQEFRCVKRLRRLRQPVRID